MADIDSETDDDIGASQAPSAVDGMVPPFLKKHVLTPQLALAVITLAGVATIPLWHLHGPDVGQMASAVHFGSLADAGPVVDKKEAPDPATPTPFPKRQSLTTPRPVVRRFFVPTAAPAAPAHGPVVPRIDAEPAQTGENVNVATNASPPAETPSAVRGTFGDPSHEKSNPEQQTDLALVPGTEAMHDTKSVDPKIGFASERSADDIGYARRTSANELSEGAVIHCRWITHVDSEQAGHVSAMVVEPVYSSIDPQVEVIPAGAQLQGWYRTAASGQTRLLVAWNRINFPDGRKFEMGEQPGSDELGGTGVSGSVNSHLGKLFGQAVLYTALNAAGQSLSRALYGAPSITQTFSDRQPQIKPTIYINPATRFDVNVVRDLPLDRYAVQP